MERRYDQQSGRGLVSVSVFRYLRVEMFETLGEAKATIEAWRQDYNESRPHSALKDLARAAFARQLNWCFCRV
jgi:transposase InsO family protein